MPSEIHQYDRGTVLRVTIKDGNTIVPLSNHSVLFLFTKPANHGTVFQKTGTIISETTGPQVQYVFESGFLDTVGQWQYQLQITSGTSQWSTDIGKFQVHRNVS